MRRVLIANRGEIACRLMRTCREMGLQTVAVYSDADASAPHVAAADAAVRLGPPPASESYLSIPKIIAAARSTKADAIHPGYGFLSENAAFAEACEEAGITFVGPPAPVIRQTGSKTAAREAAHAAGVPVVPGEIARSQKTADLSDAVRRVGVPALLKAAAGGGGRGMRIVRTDAEIADAVDAARREAERAFGDGALYVERLIERARHVEVQILGDRHGRVVHAFERDCTLQRRHQKVIEEAPAPGLHPAVRARLTDAAVRAARAVKYVNAGTIEFLVTGEGERAEFFFLEVNTRLQVEHPITEAITGLDLVRVQLQIAETGALPLSQDDIVSRGHAIECRIYAEDPVRLLPQSGRLLRYREPSGPGIRIDSGVVEGQDVTVHYDPLLAKLIATADTRETALARMADALDRYEILGLHHNVPFLRALIAEPDVAAARTHTRFIEERLDKGRGQRAEGKGQKAHDEGQRAEGKGQKAEGKAAAAIAAFVAARGPAPRTASENDVPAAFDPWLSLGPINW